MTGFPSPLDDDPEDVTWGLTTGAALWRRGERHDAIVWLKRAVEAAISAGYGGRADQLNHAATDLIAALAARAAEGKAGADSGPMRSAPPVASSGATPIKNPPPLKAPQPPPLGAPPPPRIGKGALPPPKPPPPRPGQPNRLSPPPPRSPTAAPAPPMGAFPPPMGSRQPEPTLPEPKFGFDEEPPTVERSMAPQLVLSALSAHPPRIESDRATSAPPPTPQGAAETAITRALVDALTTEPDVSALVPPPFRETADDPQELASADDEDVAEADGPDLGDVLAMLSGPPPRVSADEVDGGAIDVELSPSVETAPVEVDRTHTEATPAASSVATDEEPTPSVDHGSEPSPSVEHRPVPSVAPEPEPSPSVAPEPEPSSPSVAPEPEPSSPSVGPPEVTSNHPAFSLDGVTALDALSDEQRIDIVGQARLETLDVDEELKVAGLLLVVEGAAAVQSTIADVSAMRLGPGEVVYAQGSIPETLPLRLTATTSGTRVAVWEKAVIDAALAPYPGLLDELRRTSDRVQALAGSSIGPIGDRFDENLRSLVIDRLEVRVLHPDEVIAPRGKPVPGLVIMAVGSLELEVDGAVRERLGPGDFLFATEVLGGGAAPATARAGARGAIVLFGARALAHELMVTCPPLLEIFAGM